MQQAKSYGDWYERFHGRSFLGLGEFTLGKAVDTLGEPIFGD